MARKGAIARDPQLQRLSPGVYRGAGGQLVNQRGAALPRQSRPQVGAQVRPSTSGMAPFAPGQTSQSIVNAISGGNQMNQPQNGIYLTPSQQSPVQNSLNSLLQYYQKPQQPSPGPFDVNPWAQGQEQSNPDPYAGTRSQGWLSQMQQQNMPSMQPQQSIYPSFPQQIMQQYPGTKPGMPTGQIMPIAKPGMQQGLTPEQQAWNASQAAGNSLTRIQPNGQIVY